MRTVGLFEAKQKLSELVQRAREGEKIGITLLSLGLLTVLGIRFLFFGQQLCHCRVWRRSPTF